MQTPVTAEEDTNTKTAQLVRLMTEIGPDIPEISRRLGQFKESVRYRYKAKLLDRGFAIQAIVDHEKLGLKRMVALIDFAPQFTAYGESILTAMNELAYVVAFHQTLPDGSFLVNASVPEEYMRDFGEFMRVLAEKGLFVLRWISTFDWFRNVPMRPDSYDFDTGMWDYDWSGAGAVKANDAAYAPSERGEFDRTDLLLCKEFQTDATRTLVEIASKLQINYKKLAWHYNTHVLNKGLVKGYRLNWMGTRYDVRTEKALHRQHRYVLFSVMAKNLDYLRRAELMSRIDGLPFIWAEASGPTDYYAELFLPVDTVNEGLQFLQTALAPGKGDLWYSVLDQSKALSFTFSYQLYDSLKKGWTFDKVSLLAKFEKLLLEIEKAG